MPQCEVMLFGDEEGVAGAAEDLGAGYFPAVRRNEFGTPLIDDVFRAAEHASENSTLCYINADIILMSDFSQAVRRVQELGSYLMVGRRWDLDIQESIDFSHPEWENRLHSLVRERGVLHSPMGIDYFVFNSGLWGDAIPPFAIGRTAWDNWFIYRARKLKAPVVDATQVVTAVHQNHHYDPAFVSYEGRGDWKGPEVPRNVELAGKYAVSYNINDATLVLFKDMLRKRKRSVRVRRFAVTHFPRLAHGAVNTARGVGLYPDKEE